MKRRARSLRSAVCEKNDKASSSCGGSDVPRRLAAARMKLAAYMQLTTPSTHENTGMVVGVTGVLLVCASGMAM